MTCIDAFKNINIINQQGQLQISPCCFAPPKNTDIVDFYNNEYLAKIRNSWNNNVWPIECNACQITEKQGFESRRQGSAQWYKDHNLNNNLVELVRLDYWVGNLCNLACAICGPNNSSKWREELKLPTELKKSSVNQFWKDVDLSSLKFIHFHGGEPLLSKEHIEILYAIPHKSSVQITYNTNGTIQASSKLLELWSEFGLVHLDFSIDDIGPRFEYQRYPAKWDSVADNLQWYIETSPHNVMFGVNTTVSWLNQKYQADLDTWLKKNFSVSKFSDPIEHRKQPAWGNLSCNNNPVTIKAYLDAIDRRRGTDWRKTFPELVQP